jgi:putative PIN family toxin of toxin-antitoxin system
VIAVTADTNIYISALLFGGLPRRFLDLAREGAFRLAISDVLLTELRGVLATKFGWTEARLNDVEQRLSRFIIRVTPSETLHVIAADPDDDRVLECAVAAGSQYIVTGDDDLLRLGHYTTIQILKVADFLTLLEASPEAATDEKAERQVGE